MAKDINVASALRLLQLRSVQVSVCLISLIVTVVLYAQKNEKPIYSDTITATKTIGKTMYSRKDLWREDNQSVHSDISSTKIILSYTPARWFDEWVGTKWNTTNVFRTCPVSNCVLTQDRTMLNVADAVLFRLNDLGTCRTKFKQGQVWVLFEHESPNYAHKSLKKCNNNLVNWTLTYRRDSDFMLVHGQFPQHDTGYNVSGMYQLLRSKSKTAVGFISHCKAPSKRDEFVRKLRSYGVDIDIYGKCGNLTCGGGKDTKWKGVWNVTSGHKDNCFDVLDSQYKFYLSLENSLCKDYVTEKSLHLVLRHQIVPIIRDGANRSLYHPPHSYVDTKDFKSIKSLAKYIKYLSENFDEYLQFFNWRKQYSVETVSGVLQSVFCDMCNRMHNQHRYKRLYNNVKHFYEKSHGRETNKHICRNRLI
ncbi:alpha-(1,3)-fucosyltransferase C-like isoform X2 [Mizuhopecten yessoensis]|uniref:alpha-(1,3)-fucosyltransferase C-like isoform X2 n=1 Tax=Mizuhopecten yessoensis TaxID=6573 RepID=UPI000B45A83A|nr:alpha-(1,3)-fucosyltransferase C-like isoform X2 [Mizuhopecten yessoensis]